VFKTKACWGRRSSARFLVQLTFARITVLGLAGTLAACGGGGGGGGNAAGNSGGGGGAPALVYTGNASPAVITTSNAAILTANIFGGTDSSAAFSAAALSGSSGARDLTRSLSRAARATPRPASSTAPRVTAEPVDLGTAPCQNGGTVRTFGDVNVSGTGTLTFIWSGCNSGDSTLDGTGTMTIVAVDPVADLTLDSTFNFQRVTLTTPTVSGTVSGSVRSQLDLAMNSETTTSNLVSLDSAGRMTKTVDFVVVDFADDISASAPRLLSEKISGRLFDGIHGYVEIATNTNLTFTSNAPEFPNAGEVLLTGAANAHIRVTPFSSMAVTLGLDLNGDDAFEIAASLAWTELAGPAGTDLRDTDKDGMHDSWETAHGLNPMNPADGGTTDTDHDGATNLDEYHAGTDPQNPDSHPPAPPPASPPA
jgi:hypothetical protein